MKPIYLITLAVVALHNPNLHAGGCGHLYRQQVVAVPVVQNLFYSVGDSLLLEAAVEKAFQRREALQQKQVAPAQTAGVLASKCARCHSGESAKGNFRIDDGIDDWEFRRSVEILSGFNVPTGMKAVQAALTGPDKGDITEEMLKAQPAKQEQPPPIPTPFDEPGGPGVLR